MSWNILWVYPTTWAQRMIDPKYPNCTWGCQLWGVTDGSVPPHKSLNIQNTLAVHLRHISIWVYQCELLVLSVVSGHTVLSLGMLKPIWLSQTWRSAHPHRSLDGPMMPMFLCL